MRPTVGFPVSDLGRDAERSRSATRFGWLCRPDRTLVCDFKSCKDLATSIKNEGEPAPFTHFGTIGVTPSHGEGLSGATPTDLGDPDDYTADPGPTLTMSGPKDGNRSANGMGGTRAVG